MACQSCAEKRAKLKAWMQQKADQAAMWARVRNPASASIEPQPEVAEPAQTDEPDEP